MNPATNKKGMLLTEETLKIVVAVIGLVLLSYFLVSLFTSDTKEKKQREAAETIEEISEVISGLDASEASVVALQPQRWTLFGFVGEEEKPNSCTGDNCLCICNKVVADVFNRQIKQCDKNGACLIVSNLNDFENIKIESYKKKITSISIKESGGEISISKK